MTKSERIRRVRRLLAMQREVTGYPKTLRVEVGLRTNPVYMDTPPVHLSQAFPEGDDLWDYRMVDEWASNYSRDGEVVHLYLSKPWNHGELEDVITGWIGTDEYDPILIHVPGDYRKSAKICDDYVVWKILRNDDGSIKYEWNARGAGFKYNGRSPALDDARILARNASEGVEVYVVPAMPGSVQWNRMERIYPR